MYSPKIKNKISEIKDLAQKVKSNKNKKISNSLYQKIISDIRAFLQKQKTTLNIYHKPIISKNSKSYSSVVNGGFDLAKNKIMINVFGKRFSRKKTLFAIFHEIRHLMHYQKKLYKSYYHLDYDNIDNFFNNQFYDFKIPSLEEGYLAELDCDLFALKKLKEYDIHYDYILYDFYHTVSYRLHLSMYTHNKSMYKHLCFFNKIKLLN